VSTGRIVASKYCLLYELGRGGMGAVWAAEHLTLRSQVAVKLIDRALTATAGVARRFEREARAVASLRSPHIVQVLDFGIDAGEPYLVMELLRGEALGQRLERHGLLPPQETALVMRQLGRAMTRAHAAGLVHRDLKPDNVFLTEEGEPFHVKVLDFGIAKPPAEVASQSPTQLTAPGALVGTPVYMSPEQAEGRADERSDLWSMAVMACECTTGQLPFKGESLPALLQSICYAPLPLPSGLAPVPPGFDAWFLRAVARDPGQRYQSARELVDALLPLLAAPRSCWQYAPPRRSSGAEPAPALQLRAFPYAPRERRTEARIPSSIPAGIDRKRDLGHSALIYNASRGGALLMTRLECRPGQTLLLTPMVGNPFDSETISAQVVRTSALAFDALWRFEVGIQFQAPLDDALLFELERRARRAALPSG
jgi:serine/threonine protein kinase